MIAFCGIECTACPAYIATRNNDPEGREKISRRWSLDFKLKLTSEDVLCDGCLHLGKRLCSHCMVCKIRKCAIKKKVKNCAYCREFPCGELQTFWEAVPDARVRLDDIRRHARIAAKKARG